MKYLPLALLLSASSTVATHPGHPGAHVDSGSFGIVLAALLVWNYRKRGLET